MKRSCLVTVVVGSVFSSLTVWPLLCGAEDAPVERKATGRMRLVLEEFDGKHPPGKWNIHHYPYGDGTFEYEVRPDAMIMVDQENKNQHVTRRGFLLDPRSQYAVEAFFKTKKAARNPNSFCLNFQIAGADGSFDAICCWSINVSIEPDKGPHPDKGGRMFNMGFLKDRFKPVGSVPLQAWCEFDTEYKLRVDVNADAAGNYKFKRVTITVTRGDKLVHRREADYSEHPYQPDFTKPVRVGVNSHGGDWTMRCFKVSCDRKPILGGCWPAEDKAGATPH